MDFNPILEIKSKKDFSIKKTQKELKKFIKANSNSDLLNISLMNEEKMNFLPDELVDKLSIIIAELKNSTEYEGLLVEESKPKKIKDTEEKENDKLNNPSKKQKVVKNDNNKISDHDNKINITETKEEKKKSKSKKQK